LDKGKRAGKGGLKTKNAGQKKAAAPAAAKPAEAAAAPKKKGK